MSSQKTFLRAVLGGVAMASIASMAVAAGPSLKGRITGQDKLIPEVYAETTKPDSKRWTWREPSPAVGQQYRTLSASPNKDICIAALSQNGGAAGEAVLMSMTGGRIVPTTIVVSPGTKLVFKNFDPFAHKLFLVGNAAFKPDPQQPNASREWQAPNGSGRFEFRDELFPSIRTFVVVEPQLSSVAFPTKEGTFSFNLPAGEYTLKAFFGGKVAGSPMMAVVKDRGTLDLKEPINVGEGADSK